MEPEAIKAWSAEFRRESSGEFQLNLGFPSRRRCVISSWRNSSGNFWRVGDLRFQRKRVNAVLPDFEHNAKP